MRGLSSTRLISACKVERSTPEVMKTNERAWLASGGGRARGGLYAGRVQLEVEPGLRLSMAGAVQASAVFDNEDRGFVADMTGAVRAFGADGARIWETTLEGGVSASPAVDAKGERLFVGTHSGWIYAIRNRDGAVLWRSRLATQSDARIVSDLLHEPTQGVVVGSSWGGRFHALDARSGESRRTWDAGISPGSAAAAGADGTLYCLRAVAGEGTVFFRVSPDGEERVLHREPEATRSANRLVTSAAPVLDEARGRVCFMANGDKAGRLHAWSVEGERLEWSRDLPAASVATPTLGGDGTIVIADLEGNLRSFDVRGEPRFVYATGCEYLLAGSVTDADGRVYLGDPWGRLHVVEPDGAGRPVHETARAIQARPSFGLEGTLYLPGTDRAIHLFRNRLG
jgi:outer membrane protein assembly factor BamB